MAAYKGPPIEALQGEIKGLKEAKEFFKYLSGKQKNRAIKRAYGYATKEYRAKLKLDTPKRIVKGAGNTKKPLYKTVDIEPSKKYRDALGLVEPTWIGHLVKKGAYHQHLVVRGRKRIDQEVGGPLQRGTGQRKTLMKWRDAEGLTFTKEVAGTKARDYVTPLIRTYTKNIVDRFGDDLVRAMDLEAKKYLKQYYRAGT